MRVVLIERIDVLIGMGVTSGSTTTPHLAIPLKKSVLLRQPLLYRSKNLKALNRKASRLTLEDALNCIFYSSSL